MPGRIKRKLELQRREEYAARAAAPEAATCALCHRPLGSRVEWHHRIPKSQGGNETVPVHPICHRAIHAHVSNHDLAAMYADLDTLRARPDLRAFLRWIANKPPNFHAPTRRRKDGREDQP